MKPYLTNHASLHRSLPALVLALAAGLMLPLPALAAAVALATAPLATSTTSTVKPNMLLMFDNSGSMDWDHMPDDASDGGSAVTFRFGYYGLRSAQCNQVYFDPTVTYTPPVRPNGTSYSNASFSGAWTNGFSTGAGTVDLRSGFRASQSLSGDGSGQAGYYYNYSGSQLTQLQRNYNSTSNVFYSECGSADNSAPGRDVFTRVSLSDTATATTATIAVGGSSPTSTSVSGIVVNGAKQIMSGAAAASTSTSTLAINIRDQINLCTTSLVGNCTTTGGHGYTATVSGSTVTLTGLAATAQTMVITRGNTGNMTLVATIFPAANATVNENFANWYSYYRTRLLMMKTATGQAFSTVNKNYRVGFAKISSSNSPTVPVDTFWDNSDSVAGPVSTQRTTWYNALYNTTTSGSTPLRTALSDAGRYYAGKLGGTDPVQYSCQQNFTLLSTDGYWNTGDGYKIDGSTPVGNQDGTAPRPMYDGAQTSTQWTFTYTRDYYSTTRGSGSDRCSSSRDRQIQTQPQIGTCTKSTGTGSCTPSNWVSNGPSTLDGNCTRNPSYPGGNQTTAPVLQGSPVESAGTSGGTSDNLADIAMYYYQTDLRTPELGNCGPGTTGPLCENNVFQGATDKNLQQHMTTFTLGLGASGWMNYSSSYLSDTTGDFLAVKQGGTASSSATPPVCAWQADGSVCNWPVPGLSSGNGFIANVDDLWHAAVNGRGAYFSATNPKTLSAGLTNALASINSKIGAAAAAATSTLNPVAGNNFAYVASYTTVAWKGNLEARGINVDTGTVTENASWCIEDVSAQSCAAPGTVETDTSGEVTVFYCVTPNQVVCNGGELVGADCKVQIATACTGTMNSLVADLTDTRNIYTAKSDGSATLVPFVYANLNATDFDSSRISTLTQMQGTTLTAAQKSAAAGANLVDYLRGQHGHEFDRTSNALVDQLYRKREAVLGDALESQPAFIGAPVFSYPYPGYSTYLANEAGRVGTVYMGTNDGMMHAFAGDTGVERWAYVPSMVVPNLWKLADTSYANNHTNYVNGSPITSDICSANCGNAATAVWKTILVAGLNGGGRGYYALDITDPATPALLWEFKPNAPIGRPQDPDLGYSFGRAIITRKTDGTWVVLVTSGYNNGTVSSNPLVNNSPVGNGIGYLYVLNAATGAIISKISTGVGSAATPSGLAKIAGWNNEPAGNAAGYVYGGDLLGNVWRFDINTGAVLKFATLLDDLNIAQPVMTTPILGDVNGKRVVFIGTGKYLETSDLTTSQKQTQYAIKDDNVTATLANPRATLVQQYLINNPDGTATRLSSGTSTAVTATNPVDFFNDRGWFVDLPDLGERVNIDARLVQGTLLVPSIVPSSTVCAPGGFGWLNFLDYKTGGAIAPLPGIPMASTKYDSTIVGINVLFIQGSPIVEVVTSANPTPKKDPDVQFRAAAAGFTGKRQNWRELIQ